MKKPPQGVVMAAGKGTRMKSRRPKVLHELCGRTMIEHVLESVRAAGAADVLVVVSPELREPIEALGVRVVVQEPQNGTGHAMQLAAAALEAGAAPVLVVSGDMPLVPASLVHAVVQARDRADAELAMVTARVPLPTNFGRIVRGADGLVARIVENVDATSDERRIDEVNAAIYCFEPAALRRHLERLKPNNAQGELYLTDCIAGIAAEGGRIETVECEDRRWVMGINNRIELAAARAALQERILNAHMLAGVTIVDPAATYIDAGVVVEPDTTILPQTHLRGRTQIGRGCTIGPNSTIVNCTLGEGVEIAYSVAKDSTLGAGVTVGPFAHLRGGAVVEENAHIGNFVELKRTKMGKGSKAGHLAYLGDTEMGERVNIGAGTVTCNYDGKKKNKTKIGDAAFIGSNSSLVAPLDIGAGALTGAGAVVIRDVREGERVAGNPARALPEKSEVVEPRPS